MQSLFRTCLKYTVYSMFLFYSHIHSVNPDSKILLIIQSLGCLWLNKSASSYLFIIPISTAIAKSEIELQLLRTGPWLNGTIGLHQEEESIGRSIKLLPFCHSGKLEL